MFIFPDNLKDRFTFEEKINKKITINAHTVLLQGKKKAFISVFPQKPVKHYTCDQ